MRVIFMCIIFMHIDFMHIVFMHIVLIQTSSGPATVNDILRPGKEVHDVN